MRSSRSRTCLQARTSRPDGSKSTRVRAPSRAAAFGPSCSPTHTPRRSSRRWPTACTGAATSAPQVPHGVRLAAANQYEEWSSDIRTWIRKELAAGRIVVYADIENFFPSIPSPSIAGVLERSGLDPDVEGLTLRVLDRLRKPGRGSAASGAGLPVCPGDFFWLVADRVLLDIDTALERAPHVVGHTRWSDDFLLSARPGAEGAALRHLAMCAGDNGFRLNARKTRVFSSWQDYQTRNLASEHESVNDLIAVHRNGGSKSEVQVPSGRPELAGERGPSGRGAVAEARLRPRCAGADPGAGRPGRDRSRALSGRRTQLVPLPCGARMAPTGPDAAAASRQPAVPRHARTLGLERAPERLRLAAHRAGSQARLARHVVRFEPLPPACTGRGVSVLGVGVTRGRTCAACRRLPRPSSCTRFRFRPAGGAGVRVARPHPP